MINLNTSTRIQRPPGQVFDFVSEPENDVRWQYGTLASARFSGDLGSVGSRFRSIGHLMGQRNLSTFEVVEYEPDRKYGFRSLSGLLNLHTTYAFEKSNGGTRVDISTRVSPANSLQVEEARLENGLKGQLEENLAALKVLLESNHTRAVSANDSPGGFESMKN